MLRCSLQILLWTMLFRVALADLMYRLQSMNVGEFQLWLPTARMPFGVSLEQVWNRVTINRFSHKATRYYIDEFHLLLKEEQTAS